jgi:hypothetical protein
MSLNQFSEFLAFNTAFTFDSSSGVATQLVFTANDFQLSVDRLFALNNDVIDHEVLVHVYPAHGQDFDLCSKIVPAGAGYAGAPVVNLLSDLPANRPALNLRIADTVNAQMIVAVGAGHQVYVVACGGYI